MIAAVTVADSAREFVMAMVRSSVLSKQGDEQMAGGEWFGGGVFGDDQHVLGDDASRCELLVADFLDATIDGRFDVILALGLFDYLPQAEPFTRRMAELAAPGGCVVASFPAWSPVKGAMRKFRYERIRNCPIFNYARPQLEQMFGDAGFDPREVLAPGRSGFPMRAWRM
jgi:SAM-dependent methyltransferase